jgi:stage V sporulation protein D (sporulation-specific penicillin-binding protein)
MKSRTLRIRLLSAAFIFFAVLLLARLYTLQIVRQDAFLAKADRQYIQTSTNLFNRGAIYFRNADGSVISAATLKTGYILALNPSKLVDPVAAYDALSQIVNLDRESFLAKANKKTDPYEEVAKHLDEEMGLSIQALELPGVDIFEERWRYYPQGTLASQILGFVGFKGDELTGRYGVESYYNDILDRKNKDVYVNFFAEIFSNIKSGGKGTTEGDITLTIEPAVQAYLEKELKKVSDQFSPTLTGGIVIDPVTGEILGMGAYPSFNPNTYQTEKNQNVFINPLVQNVYEMGSIIKPLTIAAGLDKGVITPTSLYNDTGSLTLNNYTIYNFDKRARGPGTPIQEVLNQSLNTGVAYVALKMGHADFTQYIRNYGFGEKTGIDLPGEGKGLINNLNNNRDIEDATASFGQGIAITPIETVRALSSLANGGTLITPHIVKSIQYKTGVIKTTEPEVGKRVLSEQTSKDITSMLIKVVDKALLDGKIKMDRYSIAAKTGTAQMAREDGKGYYEDRYLHSFFGYFPATNPQYLVFLFTVYPKNVTYASHTMTYPFQNMAKFLLSYYQVPPDR